MESERGGYEVTVMQVIGTDRLFAFDGTQANNKVLRGERDENKGERKDSYRDVYTKYF